MSMHANTSTLALALTGYRTLQRVAIYTVILAWIILGLYFYAVTRSEYSSGFTLLRHFLSPDQVGIRFRALILLGPLILTVISHLVNERADLLYKTVAAEQELLLLRDGLIVAFANALDAKSPWTLGHSERVTAYALLIAERLNVPPADRETLRIASLLHDIGKIGTYDQILDKPGPLSDEERKLVKMHPGKGEDILKPIRQLQSVLPVIKHHHERVDGTGYPDGLAGDAIPLLARILCLADSYDAMTANRPYKQGIGKNEAFETIQRASGSQFDAAVVRAFFESRERA